MNVINRISRTATQAGSPLATIKVNTINKIHNQVQDGVELAGTNEFHQYNSHNYKGSMTLGN